jgi:hypothetical protein
MMIHRHCGRRCCARGRAAPALLLTSDPDDIARLAEAAGKTLVITRV